MNCKERDLACVVRVPKCHNELAAALYQQLVGRFVRCVAIAPGTADVWQIEEPIRISVPCGRIMLVVDLMGVEDELLQPVRGMPVHDKHLDEVTA